MIDQRMITRVEALIEKGERVARTTRPLPDNVIGFDDPVQTDLFHEWQSQSVAFLTNLLGADHSYLRSYETGCKSSGISDTMVGLGVLRAVRNDIQDGFLLTLRELVHAEVFDDFLSMADHLVKDGGYKDAAAVLAGSTLEEHLRKLCQKHAISTKSNGSTETKKASAINLQLRSQGVYNQPEWRQVDAWLDVRNKAAHGEYAEYTQQQVEHMIDGIRDFFVRNPA